MEISYEKFKIYSETAQRRSEKEKKELEDRRKKAWNVALYAAEFLRKDFKASQVMLFGSLVQNYWFSNSSDIDIAVWGIDGLKYFKAVAQVQDISLDFDIDLVSVENCNPELLKNILKEGRKI